MSTQAEQELLILIRDYAKRLSEVGTTPNTIPHVPSMLDAVARLRELIQQFKEAREF